MNKLPPIALMSRDDTHFYVLLTDKDSLKQWFESGRLWQYSSVAKLIKSEAQEQGLFNQTLAMAHHYDALLFHLSAPACIDDALAQMAFVCRLYDLFLARKVPPMRALREWQAQIWETGVLPYGQPCRSQSSYSRLACALVPQLKGAMGKAPRPH
ncbi:hypothetical protein LNQ82_06660 [Conchiformibius steedae DSM 2580]|uniref:Uncharacterized protein n=1 Tax=Conchiformibius steedae DSM 2580 TaxID=1121352 RepID=A0AAE9HUV1_9NEIS|nr:hypothetical protein [Conchiformibius steedae]QMT34123.1 hypothetical protein H3L98_03740 [Conchiformibius steedae]URD66896.1 hypothetical protein LNQ82_06660 [Conchiformibius steedae DSM 2580]